MIDKKVFFIFFIKLIFFTFVFSSFMKIKLGILNIKNQSPIKGPIILICSNFSLSKLNIDTVGLTKKRKHMINDTMPPI